MNNGDLPAMPQNNSETLCRDTGTPHWMHCGLTKREMFAMAAMQGILANPLLVANLKDYYIDLVNDRAVALADKQLAKLSKTNV